MAHYAKTPLMRYTRRSVTQTDAFLSHVETDQAQQLDHANCQAQNSKLLGPQWRKHERRKCCDGRVVKVIRPLNAVTKS